MQRPAYFAPRQRFVSSLRFSTSTIGFDGDDAVDRLVEGGDARKEILQRLTAGHFAPADSVCEIDGGNVGELSHDIVPFPGRNHGHPTSIRNSRGWRRRWAPA